MKPIQYILVSLLCASFVCYFRAFRSKLFDRMIVLSVFACGTYLILFPDSASLVANYLGVNRGADLVNYLALVMFGYLWLILYTKMRNLERQHTELVRALAIDNALQVEKANAGLHIVGARKAS
jgi:small membrane protein